MFGVGGGAKGKGVMVGGNNIKVEDVVTNRGKLGADGDVKG